MTLFKNGRMIAAATFVVSAFMTTAVFASNVGTVTRDSINVRSGDSTASQIIGITNTGDSYAILDVEPGWVKIQYPDSQEAAYIASLYVRISEADASVKDHAVNVRSGPSTGSAVVGQLNAGESVTVKGKSTDGCWYRIDYNGEEAYVSADYLGGSYLYLIQADQQQSTETKQEETDSADEKTETETKNKTNKSGASSDAEEIINKVVNEVNNSESGITEGMVIEEELDMVEEDPVNLEDLLETFVDADEDTYAVISSPGGLRLRSMPTTAANNTIISVLNDGYAVDVLEIGDGWLYISDDYDNKGYISSDYVDMYNGTKPENKGRITFDSDSLMGDAAEIAEYALQFVGTPYVYGGTDLSTGVDCSGFVYCVYKNFGITLQRNSASMYSQGTYVSKDELQAGDLLFFNTGGNTNISHVGMYLGDDMYIHSSTYSTGVIVEDLYDDYSSRTYVGAKRIIN
ncbi:MAG: SH3 domain-containing protein [Clostridiales bacterium]|nr:SH3 domain-containing protein [Clostridiales bacterium]